MTSSQVARNISLAVVATGATFACFAGYCVHQGSETFYNKIAMPIMRCFAPETSHQLAVLACEYKIFPEPRQADLEVLKTNFFQHSISSPIGMAAGFDKDGRSIEGLNKLGFGFVEVSSTTPQPLPANPTLRVFRLTPPATLYNRLYKLRKQSDFQGVVGVNLGKNRNSISAIDDYVQGVQHFGPVSDYLVINVSSLNTPGQRDLQGKRYLEAFLSRVIECRNNLDVNQKVPLLLKMSPDLSKQDIMDIANLVTKEQCRVDGLIVSNATTSREGLNEESLAKGAGGLSGMPLRSRSTQLIADMYLHTRGEIPIIGVGGISTGRDALEKLEAGASFLQFYTASIQQGPWLLSHIKSELAMLLMAKGYRNVQEAVGKNHRWPLSN